MASSPSTDALANILSDLLANSNTLPDIDAIQYKDTDAHADSDAFSDAFVITDAYYYVDPDSKSGNDAYSS
jgi:hypothetical protein